jgi:hypothetical protein
MSDFHRRLTALLACGLLAGQATAQETPAFGQTIIRTRPAESVAGSGSRTPGAMVNAGVARTLANTQLAQTPIEITEPFEPDVLDEFRVEAIDILLEQLTEFAFYFGNLLLERARLPSITPPTDTGGNNDGADTENPRDPKPGER